MNVQTEREEKLFSNFFLQPKPTPFFSSHFCRRQIIHFLSDAAQKRQWGNLENLRARALVAVGRCSVSMVLLFLSRHCHFSLRATTTLRCWCWWDFNWKFTIFFATSSTQLRLSSTTYTLNRALELTISRVLIILPRSLSHFISPKLNSSIFPPFNNFIVSANHHLIARAQVSEGRKEHSTLYFFFLTRDRVKRGKSWKSRAREWWRKLLFQHDFPHEPNFTWRSENLSQETLQECKFLVMMAAVNYDDLYCSTELLCHCWRWRRRGKRRRWWGRERARIRIFAIEIIKHKMLCWRERENGNERANGGDPLSRMLFCWNENTLQFHCWWRVQNSLLCDIKNSLPISQ